MRDAESDAVTRSLCLAEMAPWLAEPVARSRQEEALRALNDTVRSIFLIRVADGSVELLTKPSFQVRDVFNDSSLPEPEGRVVFLEELIRARLYRGFFERVLAGADGPVDGLIAVDVNDEPISGADAPVLAFQKTSGDRTVLIPDIDFIHCNFYIPDVYRDDRPWADKAPRAVFAGSTTGGRTITAQDVRDLALPRLRAGVRFKGSDHVDFRLPNIVQCESPEVAAMVRSLGVDGRGCDWQEQFGSRFILSMDGNGATCSRVAIGLASRSALAKYASLRQLYYFGALVPWRHFIPIERDEDVPSVVEAERRSPGLFQGVADEGRAFAQRHLSRAGVCGYMSDILRLHASILRGAPAPRAPADRQDAPPWAAAPAVEFGAHVQGLGDVWGWPGERVGETGGGRAIEAVLFASRGIPDGAFACRVVLDDGTFSPWREGGGMCGTRGQNRALLGFEVELRAPWPTALACACDACFTDGTTAASSGGRHLCLSPSGAALESFEITVSPSA